MKSTLAWLALISHWFAGVSAGRGEEPPLRMIIATNVVCRAAPDHKLEKRNCDRLRGV